VWISTNFWVSVDFLNRLKIDPNLQLLYKKERKIRDVWRSHPNYSPTDANRCTGWWHRPPGAWTLCDGHGNKCHEPDSTKSSFIKRLYSDSPPHTLAGRQAPCGPCVRGDGIFLETERAHLFIIYPFNIVIIFFSIPIIPQ